MTDTIKERTSFWVDFAFKVVVVLLLPWVIWVTNETYINKFHREQGNRFTMEDFHNWDKVINNRFNALPPLEWRNRIKDIEMELILLEDVEDRVIFLESWKREYDDSPWRDSKGVKDWNERLEKRLERIESRLP